jgi:hypothetical protein
MVNQNTKYTLRVTNPRAAYKSAGGWPSKGRIVMTTYRPPNYYPLSVCFITAPT